jgi:ABC-type multidrug transport system ATPase subunit
LTLLTCLELRIFERIKNAFRTFPEAINISESIKLENI